MAFTQTKPCECTLTVHFNNSLEHEHYEIQLCLTHREESARLLEQSQQLQRQIEALSSELHHIRMQHLALHNFASATDAPDARLEPPSG